MTLIEILTCLDKAVDMNLSTNCSEIHHMIVSTNSHLEFVKFLLSIPSIDQAHSDSFDRNGLITTIDKNNIDIVLKDNRIDINSYDIFKFN